MHAVRGIKIQPFRRNTWLIDQIATLFFLQLTHPGIPTEVAVPNFRARGRALPAWWSAVAAFTDALSKACMVS